MLSNVLRSAVLAAVPFLSALAQPADARPVESADRVELARTQDAVYGPYATIRRANEVANYARSLGYSAVAYHNGDGYYVRVW